MENKLTKLKRFYQGSKRYFLSSLGFPPEIQEKVTIVYNFCRLVDDSVDEPESSSVPFAQLLLHYRKALGGNKCGNDIIDNFVTLSNNLNFDPKWTNGLFNSMRMDLENYQYINLDDTLTYCYGVSEIIGLFMCKVLDLPEVAYEPAILLGRSAQWNNFMRDIEEDNQRGRTYFPKSDLDKFQLLNLSVQEVNQKPDQFRAFMQLQADRFYNWVEAGEAGYKYIPQKLLKPIRFATNLDKWRTKRIMADPFRIYTKKINPGYPVMLREIIRINTSNKKIFS